MIKTLSDKQKEGKRIGKEIERAIHDSMFMNNIVERFYKTRELVMQRAKTDDVEHVNRLIFLYAPFCISRNKRRIKIELREREDSHE